MAGLDGGLTPQDRYWADPSAIMTDAGFSPDNWQRRVLESAASEILLLATRQGGKTLASSALVLQTALREPGSLTLILSPSQRQSSEMLNAKVLPLYRSIEAKHPTYVSGPGRLKLPTNKTEIEFRSGSRIIALPDNIKTVVGYSGASLLVIDEAAQASDALYSTVRPMMATSQGRIIALSTPFGRRGFFFEEWENGAGWYRECVTADECPRIPREFLATEKKRQGERWFMQNFYCTFHAPIDSLFDPADIEAAFAGSASEPLFPQDDVD